jgi:hypothetical protein
MGLSVFVFWVIFAIVVAIAENGRGRNPLGWFVLACVVSPLLAVILLVALPSPESGRLSLGRFVKARAGSVPLCRVHQA